MKTKTSSIVLAILFTLLTATGQTLMKTGVAVSFLNINLLLGLAVYGIGTVLFIFALKNGELSVLYPFIGLGVVWVTLSATFFLHEELSLQKITGVFLIVSGVSLLGFKR
jgi:multidrug transporter EmrE-like cation transporter